MLKAKRKHQVFLLIRNYGKQRWHQVGIMGNLSTLRDSGAAALAMDLSSCPIVSGAISVVLTDRRLLHGANQCGWWTGRLSGGISHTVLLHTLGGCHHSCTAHCRCAERCFPCLPRKSCRIDTESHPHRHAPEITGRRKCVAFLHSGTGADTVGCQHHEGEMDVGGCGSLSPTLLVLRTYGVALCGIEGDAYRSE